jgi:hypothetical protein
MKNPTALLREYSSAVGYCCVRDAVGDENIGTCFHVGEWVLLTARHVVEDKTIMHIGFGDSPFEPPRSVLKGPLYHPNPKVDVAAFVVSGMEQIPAVQLGMHLDDWIADQSFLLLDVVVMGYPPIPQSQGPVLVATRGETNAVVDKYTGPHPHFVISCVARGGFSGAPCLICDWDGAALGLVTESLAINEQPAELGYMAVISVEPLLECLHRHDILPKMQKEGWDGLWDEPWRPDLWATDSEQDDEDTTTGF